MKLNMKKCINITANRKQSKVKFVDNTEVPRKEQATYLGAILSDNSDNTKELNNRIADCNNTIHRMKLFWDKAENTIYNKKESQQRTVVKSIIILADALAEWYQSLDA